MDINVPLTIHDAASLRQHISVILEGTAPKEQFKKTERSINAYTKSKECWIVILGLLDPLNPQNTPQIRALASNILKDKFKFDFGQLGQDFAMMHQTLLTVIKSIESPTPSIRNNLSLCVVYSYMHKYEELGDLLEYLKTNFASPACLPYIFNILTMLPEELDNYKVVIEEQRRTQLLKLQEKIQVKVLVQLNSVAAANWENPALQKCLLLDCFSNWVQFHYDPQILQQLPGHFVLQAALKGLGDSLINAECVKAIVTVIKSIDNPQRDPELFEFLANHIMLACTEARRLISQDADEQSIEPYVRVICQFARRSISRLTSSPTEESNKFLQNIITLSSQRDVEYTQQTTKFWLRFCEHIHEGHLTEAAQYYKPLLLGLLLNSCYVIELTQTEAIELNTKTNKQVENKSPEYQQRLKLREDLEDLFQLIGAIVGEDQAAEFLLVNIAGLNVESKSFWLRFESFMYPLVNLVSEMHEQHPPAALTQAIDKITSLQTPYKCVERVTLNFLSQCSNMYRKDLDITMKIFNYVSARLADQRLATIASKAFQNICENNNEFVRLNVNTFLELFRHNPNNQRIMLGILSALATDQKLLELHLPVLCRPYVQEIASLMGNKQQDSLALSPVQQNKVMECTSKLAVIIQTLKKDSTPTKTKMLVSQLFKSVWPYFKPEILNPDDSREYDFLQRILKFLKNSMRLLDRDFYVYMEEVFSVLLEAYEKHPVGCYIYAVEVAVTVFYKHQDLQASLVVIFEKACDLTFVHLSKLQNFEDNPDLANDFFGMCLRFLRYNQKTILSCKKLSGILQLVNVACGIQNKDIVKPLYSFVERLFMLYWSNEQVEKFNTKLGSEPELKISNPLETKSLVEALKPSILVSCVFMLEKMMHHLQIGPSSAIREYICDTFQAQIKAFPAQNPQIWGNILTKLSTDILTENQKIQILNCVATLNEENLSIVKELLYRISRRFLNRKLRAPVS